jgi:predicted kinase
MEVVIMRGVPGSGKTTHINTFKKQGTCVVCSADDYQVNERGEYDWRADRQGEAHKGCLSKFLSWLNVWAEDIPRKTGIPDFLVVDNTNTTAAELAPYVRLAEVFGVEWKIVRVMCDFRVACERNTHNVPRDKIARMWMTMMSESLPFGWSEEIIFTDPSPSAPIELARFGD